MLEFPCLFTRFLILLTFVQFYLNTVVFLPILCVLRVVFISHTWLVRAASASSSFYFPSLFFSFSSRVYLLACAGLSSTHFLISGIQTVRESFDDQSEPFLIPNPLALPNFSRLKFLYIFFHFHFPVLGSFLSSKHCRSFVMILKIQSTRS